MRSNRQNRRSAITLVQVLVVVVIVGLTGGLFMAAIVKARESANQMKCSNNLKQIGLSVHNYNDTNDHMPPLVDQGENSSTGKSLESVVATLDPYIEASPMIYRPNRSPASSYHAHSSVAITYPQKESGTGTTHGGLANGVRRVFLDPSDISAVNLRDIPMTLPDGTTGYYATGSYAANGMLKWGNGTFGKSFPRGTENTILFAERPQVCVNANGETIYNLWGVGFYSPHMPAFATLTPSDPVGLWSTGQIAPLEPVPGEDAADQILVRIGRKDAETQRPDFASPIQTRCNSRSCDPRFPGSTHRNGMQVLMADGSVRMLTRDVSASLFWTMCTAGGNGE